MADEIEKIEARLAAYVDDTLPPAQRVEIEAYLKTNPAHARLISDLQSIRTGLASLPQEKAPAEILDTLQSHLERHTLLDGVEDASDSRRVNHWPQLGAVAAVLLLSGGLGLLVYQVLPRPQSPLALALTSAPASNVDLLMPTKDSQRPDEVVGLKDKKESGDGVAPTVPAIKPSTSNLAADGFGVGGSGSAFFADAGQGRIRAAGELPTAKASGPQAPPLVRNQTQNQSQNLALDNSNSGNNVQAEIAMQSSQSAIQDGLNSPVATPLANGPAGQAEAATAQVVIVTTDEPAITQNLLALYFAQHQMVVDHAGDGPDAPPQSGQAQAGFQAGPLLQSKALRLSSTVPADMPADFRHGAAQTLGGATRRVLAEQVPVGGRATVIRNVSAEQIADVQAFVNAQRPARQSAKAYLAFDKDSDKNSVSVPAAAFRLTTSPAAPSLSNPATQPAAATTMPASDQPGVAAILGSSGFIAVQPAAASPAGPTDLVIIVVPAATTRPGTTMPTTNASVP